MNTQYLDEISRILQQVRLTQLPQMEKAARMLHWRAEKSVEDMCRDAWRWQQHISE